MGKKKSQYHQRSSTDRHNRFVDTNNRQNPRENSNDQASNDSDDDSVGEEFASTLKRSDVKIYMWEFGQNDTKRDSGSKLCRMGLAETIKVGQSFNGIVLSSETDTCVSQADLPIIQQYGIAGINCSWNRLEEIPFVKLGKKLNQRCLPLLFAANTVNYGKPFKMNTAEAIAATLWICGYKEDATVVMSSFSYGMEFLRLNMELFEMYSECKTSDEIRVCQDMYIEQRKKDQEKKEKIKELERQNTSGYLDESDLPPMTEEDDYDYLDEDEEQPIA